MAEYDAASGTWQPTTRVVVPPPPQPAAAPVIVAKPDDAKPKDGVLTKVGRTLKKPLEWLPWRKSEEQPAPTTAPTQPAPPPVPTQAAR